MLNMKVTNSMERLKHRAQGRVTFRDTLETVWQVLIKSSNGHLAFSPTIPLLGIHPREIKNVCPQKVQGGSQEPYHYYPKVEITYVTVNRILK